MYSKQLPLIGIMVRMFANDPGDLGSIPGRVKPKTQKLVLDASLINIRHYKVRIKGNECWYTIKQSNQQIVIYKALCFDVAQGRINGAPNETRTHSFRFDSLAS